MSTIKANNIFDSAGGNTAKVNGVTPLGSENIASQAQAEAGTSNTTVMTPLRADQHVNARFSITDTAPVYACRCWANMDLSSGTPVLRASGNVSSLTDVATGVVRVNFATAMVDANYAAITMCGTGAQNSGVRFNQALNRLTTSVDVNMTSDARAGADGAEFHVAIFR